MTRVFVIASTPAVAEQIGKVLAQSGEIAVVRLALHGEDVLQQLHAVSCDIVAIDGTLEDAAFAETARRIMNTQPMPMVVFGTEDRLHGMRNAVESLNIGALSVMSMPERTDGAGFAAEAHEFAKTLRLMSEIKVVRRWDSGRFESLPKVFHPDPTEEMPEYRIDVVAIGASAGGTKALQTIFQTLPPDFPVPILVVQHMARGYVGGLARWLADQCPLDFIIAEDGVRPRPGCVYLASDDRHLTVGADHRILLSDDESVNGFKPSIARLFSSIHDAYGAHSAAVLLSGMGNDGAAEMRRLFDAGACTIAQDKETSLIHGIPGEAIKLAAARFILPVQEISPALQAVVRRTQSAAQD
jgi:two-component system chemotaxis response regulator CheB